MHMESSPEAIQKQLEALMKWREGYRVILEAKHQQERASFEMYCASDHSDCKIEEIYEKEEVANDAQSQRCSEESVPELSKQTSGYLTDYKLELETKDLKTSIKAPKKFLRRGEGIKQRFKISPDAFNLDKLPPYKYANAHPNLRKHSQIKGKIKKIDAPKNKEKVVTITNALKEPPTKLDVQELNFQRLLFESKATVSSTPDPKSTGKSVSNSSIATKSTNSIGHADDSQPPSRSSLDSRTSNNVPIDIAWAKVLDPFNIKPVAVTEFRTQSAQQNQSNQLDETDDEHLNIFELLEEKAKEGSFNMNSSVIKRVLAKKVPTKQKEEQDSDIIPVTTEIREAKIGPKVTVNVELSSSDSDGDSESECENRIESEGDAESVEEEEVEEIDVCEDIQANEANGEGKESGKSTARLHVRFVDDTNVTQDDGATTLQAEDTLSDMNTELFFEQAKNLLLDAMSQNPKYISTAKSSDSSQLSPEDIKKLAEQSKERLSELEHQIALMRENNLQLIRAKQEHENDKVAFMQEQEEALEKLNDEKVKIEIQLHDERMKLEKDRRKMEEKLRAQKAAIMNSERKEIVKLKEEIESLQAKLRDKEQAHIAAQGRLRAQLRCYEKEQKDLYEEIEHLKKENKKLERHNAQLAREQNMTMLNEINRNIVKLAETKSTTPSTTALQPNSAKNSAKRNLSSRSNFKKVSNSEAVMKTMKITENTFANMLSNNSNEDDIDNTDDLEEIIAPETAVPDTNIDSKSITSPNAGNDTSESGFKVLTRETLTEDGGKEILYPNGTIRKDSADGTTVRMMYFNGDVKETNVNEGTIKYYYSKTNTWHTTYLDGLEILEFPNGQIEHRHPSGTIEIHFPNNSVKVIDPKDKEKLAEWRFHDGSILHEMRNGERLLILSNGQKELHTKQFKRREYPDGTIKTVFPDGSYETRYSNGRIRLKDKQGNLIVDSEMQAGGN